MMAALEGPIRVGGDERERKERRRQALDDDLCNGWDEPPQPALLPRRDERTHAVVVDDGGACAREGEPASRALTAPTDRPRRRAAAAFALRPAQARQREVAASTQLRPTGTADDAAL